MTTTEWELSQASMGEMKPAIAKLVQLISDYAGLKLSGPLLRKLEFALKGLKDDDLNAWIDSIIKDPYKTELPALIENVNNHETYFFRDQMQMMALEREFFPELIQQKIKAKDFNIRIWSAACSTGEEVYTLGMLLLHAFIKAKLSVQLDNGLILPPHGWKIEINGTDISRQVIRKAQEGRYEESSSGLSSFRNFPEQYRHFFQKVDEKTDGLGGIKVVYQVNPVLKTFVNFQVSNLMQPIPPYSQCDLVLCRNVLIYLQEDAQQKVLQVIKRSLRFGGMFMLSTVDKLVDDTNVKTHRDKGCVFYEKC